MSALIAPLLAGWLGAACVGCAEFPPGEDWQGYERTALSLGKMRMERAPEGLPVSHQALADNFRRITFGIEADVLEAGDAALAEAGRLRRWERPVRYHVVSLGTQRRVHAEMVHSVMGRLTRATGHDVALTGAGEPANLRVMFLRPQDYLPAAEFLRERAGAPWLARQVERFGRMIDMPCVGIFLYAQAEAMGRPDEITFALALIRAGLPPRLGRACVEEELAQAMGLPNDHPHVRPSVFNDDQEFALLTHHDEALLEILYDDRLHVGMTEAEAMELVPEIIDGMDTRALSGRAH